MKKQYDSLSKKLKRIETNNILIPKNKDKQSEEINEENDANDDLAFL